LQNFRIQWLDRNDPKDFEQWLSILHDGRLQRFYTVNVGRAALDGLVSGICSRLRFFEIEADGYAPVFSRVFSSRKGDVGDVATIWT